MNQNLKQRRQLSTGLIMIDQKHRHDTTKKSHIAAFMTLIFSFIFFR